ncbi:MAG: hypothetical protein KVP17_003904 [Porospora cf. gigantea B]|uniref:uncharacterized protein n=1 Tax=Porospora cf. gigantea B TaxID=2853592 RepID=UPI003571A366|nr:MAG: hypothetical protein KVP17_003904 [Porospora cf. gigantea B]
MAEETGTGDALTRQIPALRPAPLSTPNLRESPKHLLHRVKSGPLEGRMHFKPIPIQRSELIGSLNSPIYTNYVLKEIIGKGTFGAVHAAVDRNSQTTRAVKKVSKRRPEDMSQFREEIRLYKNLDHPNICRLVELFEDYVNLYIVMEHCTGGELFHLLKEVKLDEAEAARLLRQILSAVCYLHAQGIVHRDLKPENFLFEGEGRDSYLKLIDFGLATRFDPKSKLTKKVGTMCFVAPQVLEGSYTEKCDIWSVGVIMHIMLSGVLPFDGPSDSIVEHQVLRCKSAPTLTGDAWVKVSPEAKDLLSLLLSRNEDDRLSAEQALQHPWITKNDPVSLNLTRWPSPCCDSLSPIDEQACCRLSEFDMHTKSCHNFPVGHKWRLGTSSLGVEDDSNSVSSKSERKAHSLLSLLLTRVLPSWRIHATRNPLQRAVLLLLARLADSKSTEGYRSLFRALDAKNNGMLDEDGVRAGLARIREVCDADALPEGTEEELVALLPYLDVCGNGTIQYSEFLASVTDTIALSRDSSVIKDAFRLLDKDADGRISVAELRTSLGWSTSGFYPRVRKIMSGHKYSGNEEEQAVDAMMDEAGRGLGFLTFEMFTDIICL